MVVVESTARCPRTPIVLFALEEAGREYRVEVREDGFFEAKHGMAGPMVHAEDQLLIGLLPLLSWIRSLPELRPGTQEDAHRADPWVDRLAAIGPTVARVLACKRTGAAPADADAAAITALLDRLEADLDGRDWLGGDAPAAADFGLLFVRRLFDLGVPAGPRTQSWLARLQARQACQRALTRVA